MRISTAFWHVPGCVLLAVGGLIALERSSSAGTVSFEIVGQPTLTFQPLSSLQTGSFEVALVSSDSPQPQIGDFTAQVEKTDPGSYVTFTGFSSPAGAPYVFPGQSGTFGPDPGDPNSAVGSDGYIGSAANPTLGALTGLFDVSFTLAANTPPGTVIPLNFVTDPNADFPLALDDPNSVPISFAAPGSFAITVAAVPEPTGLALAGLAGLGLIALGRRRNAGRLAPQQLRTASSRQRTVLPKMCRSTIAALLLPGATPGRQRASTADCWPPV